MGCCCSKKEQIHLPTVQRAATTTEATTNQPPLGVLLTGGAKLRQAGLTGRNVRVAVIDSGVDKDHPGFDGQVKKQEWYRSGTPLSEDDHGTHVAGTVHLMAPDAEIYDYRVFGRRGRLNVTAAVAAAIRQAVKDGCHVINMSLGGPLPSPAIRDAVKHAQENGVILVCAAGNEGDKNPLTNEISYPASFTECVSIAAVSKKDGLPVAFFSNSNAEVDYAGIGVDVISFKPGGGFQVMSGTSMASPHVAGFVACLISTIPGGDKKSQKDAALRQFLTNNHAIDIGTAGRDNATGIGFLSYLNKPEFDQLLPQFVASQLVAAKIQ